MSMSDAVGRTYGGDSESQGSSNRGSLRMLPFDDPDGGCGLGSRPELDEQLAVDLSHVEGRLQQRLDAGLMEGHRYCQERLQELSVVVELTQLSFQKKIDEAQEEFVRAVDDRIVNKLAEAVKDHVSFVTAQQDDLGRRLTQSVAWLSSEFTHTQKDQRDELSQLIAQQGRRLTDECAQLSWQLSTQRDELRAEVARVQRDAEQKLSDQVTEVSTTMTLKHVDHQAVIRRAINDLLGELNETVNREVGKVRASQEKAQEEAQEQLRGLDEKVTSVFQDAEAAYQDHVKTANAYLSETVDTFTEGIGRQVQEEIVQMHQNGANIWKDKLREVTCMMTDLETRLSEEIALLASNSSSGLGEVRQHVDRSLESLGTRVGDLCEDVHKVGRAHHGLQSSVLAQLTTVRRMELKHSRPDMSPEPARSVVVHQTVPPNASPRAGHRSMMASPLPQSPRMTPRGQYTRAPSPR